MELKLLFNKHRIYALGLMIFASISGWFSLVLITDPIDEGLQITSAQWFGLGFAILIGVVAWVRSCLTVKPYKISN